MISRRIALLAPVVLLPLQTGTTGAHLLVTEFLTRCLHGGVIRVEEPNFFFKIRMSKVEFIFSPFWKAFAD